MDDILEVVNAIEIGLEGVPGQNVGDVEVSYVIDDASDETRITIEFASNAASIPTLSITSENLLPADASVVVCAKDSCTGD